MPRHPYMRFYPSAWRSEPTLKLVSRAARSLWIDLIGLIHEGDECYLHINGRNPSIKEIAGTLGDDPRTIKTLLAELERAKVFDRDEQDRIVCRRRVREKVRAELAEKHGRSGWQKRQEMAKKAQSTLEGTLDPISISISNKNISQVYRPTKTNNIRNGELPLDDHENFAFDGEHLRVTEREFQAIEKAYPNLNVLGVIRAADQRYPRRMKKDLTPRAYLETVLAWKDDEYRNARAERREERTADGPDPHAGSFLHCRDKRLWWRQEGARHLRMGIWNRHIWGPEPWDERTECPVGTFAAEELIELRSAFDGEIARKAEEDRNAEIAQRGAGRGASEPRKVFGRGP